MKKMILGILLAMVGLSAFALDPPYDLRIKIGPEPILFPGRNDVITISAIGQPNVSNYFEYSFDLVNWTRIGPFNFNQAGGIMSIVFIPSNSGSRMYFRALAKP